MTTKKALKKLGVYKEFKKQYKKHGIIGRSSSEFLKGENSKSGGIWFAFFFSSADGGSAYWRGIAMKVDKLKGI